LKPILDDDPGSATDRDKEENLPIDSLAGMNIVYFVTSRNKRALSPNDTHNDDVIPVWTNITAQREERWRGQEVVVLMAMNIPVKPMMNTRWVSK